MPRLEEYCNGAIEKTRISKQALKIIKWTHWDLNPGPSACEADVIPLHHVPNGKLRTYCHRCPTSRTDLDNVGITKRGCSDFWYESALSLIHI